MERNQITQAILKERLDYDPETGFFTWKLSNCTTVKVGDRAGCKSRGGGKKVRYYRMITLFSKGYLEHRLAFLWMTGSFPDGEVDHINTNSQDNRWKNLRHATRSQNNANRTMGSNNSSGFKGVVFVKNKQKYVAAVYKDKKRKHIGYFDTALQAHEAYCKALSELHGIYGRAA